MYVDANATYPVDPKHYDALAAQLKEVDGNPSSIHARGRVAKVALEEARVRVARIFGGKGQEIVFTSGATEANNMVVQGLVQALLAQSAGHSLRPHVIIGATEHSSIREAAGLMYERGLCRLDVAPVRRDASLDVDALLSLVKPDTGLVCLMHANNEVGTIHPVQGLAEAIKQRNPATHVHTDAVQTCGKFDLSWMASSSIDSACISAHKIGGLKGIGALYLRPGIKLSQLIAGGGQERGRRPGTENMAGVLSLGMRCKALLDGELAQTTRQMQRLRKRWLLELRQMPEVVVHGDPEQGLPNTINFHVEGVNGDDILLNLDLAGIQASSGSACSSGSARPSAVLLAMGYDEWTALNSVRISFTAEGDEGGIDLMAATLRAVVERVRRR